MKAGILIISAVSAAVLFIRADASRADTFDDAYKVHFAAQAFSDLRDCARYCAPIIDDRTGGVDSSIPKLKAACHPEAKQAERISNVDFQRLSQADDAKADAATPVDFDLLMKDFLRRVIVASRASGPSGLIKMKHVLPPGTCSIK